MQDAEGELLLMGQPVEILGVCSRAEHLVGDGEQQAAVGDERVVSHEADATPGRAVGAASGFRSHASAKPSDSMPSATLPLVVKLANEMTAVSSTSAAAPSASSSRADKSSVTVGGVWLIASAYAMTSRSSGVNTSDSRHRGTSRAFSRSRFSLCAWK